jgi:hypothetical protein
VITIPALHAGMYKYTKMILDFQLERPSEGFLCHSSVLRKVFSETFRGLRLFFDESSEGHVCEYLHKR